MAVSISVPQEAPAFQRGGSVTYLDPLQMLIRLLALQKTYAGLTD